MQLRLSGPRSVAMATIAVLFGWWLAGNDVSTLAHYRSLSHQALLNELAASKDGSFATSVMGAIVLVGIVVFGVDLLTYFYETLWARISGRGGTPPAGEPFV